LKKLLEKKVKKKKIIVTSQVNQTSKAKKSNLNQSDLETVIDTFCKSLEKALKEGQNIELRGFGTFFVKKIKEKYSPEIQKQEN
jgi:nucleoid DNA-binding protein